MVNINLTLVIQLALFLLFLWGTKKFIFKPILKVLDERDEKIYEDRDVARQDNKDASELEKSYRSELNSAKRAVHDEIREAYRNDQKQHLAQLVERRHAAEKEIFKAHNESMKKVEAERSKYNELLPEIADTISTNLGLGGKQK